MKVSRTRIEGVLLLEPRLFPDDRGYFLETWSHARYADLGIPGPFVQDNLSCSRRHVLRGLHFQKPTTQGKLVTVLHGSVFDVAVDLRHDSPTFGGWVGVNLSSETHHQLWVPEGFAHGFVVLSDEAIFSYKCTDVYAPPHERAVRWDDPDVGIAWPVAEPVLSAKDAQAPLLRDVPGELLFSMGGA